MVFKNITIPGYINRTATYKTRKNYSAQLWQHLKYCTLSSFVTRIQTRQ